MGVQWITVICRWTEDDDGVWNTDCGNAHVFTADGPSENGYRYCPYCGAELDVAQLPTPEPPK